MRIDLVGFSLGAVVATRWAATIGLTDVGKAKRVGSVVTIAGPVGGVPQAGVCLREVTGVCPALRTLFGDLHLAELQVPVGPGQPAGSIVTSLADAASGYDVTAVESQFDYLVNGRNLRVGSESVPIATGTRSWRAERLTRHADDQLGEQSVAQPVAPDQLAAILLSRHTPALHHSCTGSWLDEQLFGTPAPRCGGAAAGQGSPGPAPGPVGQGGGGGPVVTSPIRIPLPTDMISGQTYAEAVRLLEPEIRRACGGSLCVSISKVADDDPTNDDLGCDNVRNARGFVPDGNSNGKGYVDVPRDGTIVLIVRCVGGSSTSTSAPPPTNPPTSTRVATTTNVPQTATTSANPVTPTS